MIRLGFTLMGLLAMTGGCLCQAPPTDFEDFDTELAALREKFPDPAKCQNVIVGECNGGDVLFLHRFGLDSGTTRFFKADTREFLGYEFTNAFEFFLCGGPSYYPYPIVCNNRVVTEVLCGDFYEVGDDFR